MRGGLTRGSLRHRSFREVVLSQSYRDWVVLPSETPTFLTGHFLFLPTLISFHQVPRGLSLRPRDPRVSCVRSRLVPRPT